MLSFAYRRAQVLLLAVATLALASSLPAYIDHLSEAEVIEAYTFAQRHDQDVFRFFKAYQVTFPNARSGTNVSFIAVRTPFCAVVQNALEKGSTYPMSRAREDYAAKPYPFAVMVSVSTPFAAPWTANDLADPKGRFWKQFDVELSQNHRIAPGNSTARPLYSVGGDNTAIVGAELRLEYDVRDIASKMIQVRVTGPGTQSVTAEFDLDTLR
jgi:hypothetical protein